MKLIVFCVTDYVYRRTVFGQRFSDTISKFLLFLLLLLLFAGVFVVVSSFVVLFYYHYHYYCYYYYYYIFVEIFLILCGYVRYYFVKLLERPDFYVHDVGIPFYVTFNIYNFSIAFFIALS